MRSILSFLIMLVLTGCSHVYKHYDYEADLTSVHGGEVTVVLEGHYTEVSESPSVTKVGSPYCASVYWKSEDLSLEGNEIETHITSLSQISGLVIKVDKITSGKIKIPNKSLHSDAEDRVYFNASACGLMLEKHEPVSIEGVIIIEGRSQKFKTTLQPKYWQERRNDTFDSLMSV